MLTEWDYLNAINIAKADSYVNWEQLEFKNQNCDPEFFSLCCQQDENAEKKIIRRDRYRELSDEAKQIIMIILSAPSEMLQMITPKTNKFSIRLISNFISKNFFQRTVPERKTQKVVKEIKQFVKEL